MPEIESRKRPLDPAPEYAKVVKMPPPVLWNVCPICQQSH